MPITREHPDHVFKTSDSRLFDNAEEAHCHERYIQVADAVLKYCNTNNVAALLRPTLYAHAYALAPLLAPIVRATPLANG